MNKVRNLQQGLKHMTELGVDLKGLPLGSLLSQYSTLGIIIYEAGILLHEVKSNLRLTVTDIFYKCQSLQTKIHNEIDSRINND